MTKVKKLKALLSFFRLPDDPFVSRVTAIHDGILANTVFSPTPIDMATFKGAISNYAASAVAALDGSKQAILNKKKLREVVVKMTEQLAHHVEAVSDDDPVTFASSGFEIRPSTRVPPQPLAQPTITGIDQGKSGELLVDVSAVDKARMYEIRSAAITAGGTAPTTWISTPSPSAKKAIPVENLTPGTTYIFQVRAYGKLGFTDWSIAVQRMCI
jgi:hypothetical protein